MLKLVFFARYREMLGTNTLDVPIDGTMRVSELIEQLSSKGDNWHSVFSQKNLMIAVNQNISSLDADLEDGDEVAFFPPVSGG